MYNLYLSSFKTIAFFNSLDLNNSEFFWIYFVVCPNLAAAIGYLFQQEIT